MDEKKIIVDISWVSILKVITALLAVWLVWSVQDIIILFFIVLVLVAALSPVVDFWSKKINRALATSLVYLLILACLVLIGFVIIPPVATQVRSLSYDLPYLSKQIFPVFGAWRDVIDFSTQSLTSLASQLQTVSSSIYSTTVGFIGGVVGVFTVLVLTFYLLLEEQGAKNFLHKYLPIQNRETYIEIMQKVGLKMGAWMRGQLFLALVVGVIDFAGLVIIGVPYALTLAVWAGLTEIIPYIGPVLGAIPAIIIALTISPIQGLLVLIFFIVVQQVESNFLVPKIMQKAVGLSPVIIILVLLIGGKLAGILGIILAVPVAATIGVFVQELPKLKNTQT
ncbi:AI-2E family transporter [Candidatus Berkelbacteria bacterium]|nr:AI-2E family transporter [Candidatus Berkelbacteria bacterium]